MSFSAKMNGLVVIALLSLGMAAPGMAQEPPVARAALIQCLMTAAEPGERVDGICSDLAMDVCGVGRSDVMAEECRAELACRFLEEAQVLAARSGAEDGFGELTEECDGDADATCRQGRARAAWIAARRAARAAGAGMDVADAEVARCWLD